MIAYLDPGTGSIVLQIIIGVVLGGLFMLRVYWGRVKAFLFRNKDKDEDIEQDR